jgi:hypothetical protein
VERTFRGLRILKLSRFCRDSEARGFTSLVTSKEWRMTAQIGLDQHRIPRVRVTEKGNKEDIHDSKSALLFAAGGVWGLALPHRGFINPLIADSSSNAHSLLSLQPDPPFFFSNNSLRQANGLCASHPPIPAFHGSKSDVISNTKAYPSIYPQSHAIMTISVPSQASSSQDLHLLS